MDHHHVHCIVTGGGLTPDGSAWKGTRGGYLFNVKALSKVFQAKYRDGLQVLYTEGKLQFHGLLAPLAEEGAFQALKRKALHKDWVVYAKRPFAGPEQVLASLSRYTHRVAIGNSRLISLDKQALTVTFGYKDYAKGAKRKVMTLGLDEFLRRFCLHILPERFVKIRHYGLLANRGRQERHDAGDTTSTLLLRQLSTQLGQRLTQPHLPVAEQLAGHTLSFTALRLLPPEQAQAELETHATARTQLKRLIRSTDPSADHISEPKLAHYLHLYQSQGELPALQWLAKQPQQP